MAEPKCRWDNEAATYTTDTGEPCDTPRREHCGAKRCNQHLGWGELTCARCVGRTRRDIRRIAEYAPLLDAAALESRSINSEAANLAGPAADVEAWSWRKVTAMQGRAWHLSLEEDDDDWHPYTVLTRWAMMLTEDYSHDRPERWSIAKAARYLDAQLTKVAHDDGQDFGLLAKELHRCRDHLDAALSVRPFVQRGVPCPTCLEGGKVERLAREYAHWCGEPDCCREHYDTDAADVWVCPRDREHWWTHADYTNRLEERKIAG